MDLKKFLESNTSYQLYIFDVNWVLDNLLETKIKLAKNILWLKKEEIADFICSLDRIYELNKWTKLHKILSSYFKYNNKITNEQIKMFESMYYSENIISPYKIEFINELSLYKKVCLYTSLPKIFFEKIIWDNLVNNNIRIYTLESFQELKPSYNNLKTICLENECEPSKSILFWDNVIIDLMPAKLLWIRTVLVTPYLDEVIKEDIVL